MPLYDPVVPARYAEVLLQVLRTAPTRVVVDSLSGAGIDTRILQVHHGTLTVSQFDALLVTLRRYLGRNDLGFEMGKAVKLEDHPAIGLALRQCTTVDALLRMLVRYARLMSPSFGLSYERNDHQGEYCWRPAAAMSAEALHAMQESVAVALHCELKTMLGDRLTACDMYVSIPPPPHRERYRQLYPTRFHFGSQALPEVRLVIPGELLDLPSNPSAVPAEPVSEFELQTRQRSIARSALWGDWIRMILREAEGCQPSLAQLAKLLNVSDTTLVRQLAKEGLCLRDRSRTG